MDLDQITEMILSKVQRERIPVLEAAEGLRGYFLQSQMGLIDEAVTGIEALMESNYSAQSAVLNPNYNTASPWYEGPRDGENWSRYRSLLESKGHPGLDELDGASTRVTSLLANPRRPHSTRKGLVMGNVQSGKTANFAAVIAKAADAGYGLVIVLSGLHNNLRRQTQVRLDRDVFDPAHWFPLTSPEEDFVAPGNPQTLFRRGVPMACVVKKNAVRLRRLVQWLRSVPPEIRVRVPILVIDDEADQATPNSEAQRNRISAINQNLRNLWKEIPTGSYLAYTATPFANVFMDPDDDDDLFPTDFITTLRTGPGYFGAERVFGLSADPDEAGTPESDGLDMVRTIPLDEANVLRPPTNKEERLDFVPDIPRSLREAVHWFVVATAIRWAREDKDHSSMLVHTTHYADPHFAMADQLEDLRNELLSRIGTGFTNEFESVWKDEVDRVASERTQGLPSWDSVLVEIPGVLEEIRIIVDNGASEDRLDYETPEPQTVIAVGGGTLSRGLTLEGLITSYFTRTSSTYDTLMQMGRWFGYRPGYEDLPRLWVTEGLDEDYAFLASVEDELRAEIESLRFSEYTPKEVGLRVRAHPGRLEITSRSRMFNARQVQMDLNGVVRQTFILDASDASAIAQNFRLAEHLLAGHNLQRVPWSKGRAFASGLSSDAIARFVAGFHQHDDQQIFSAQNVQLILKWISESAKTSPWNVVLMGNTVRTAPGSTVLLGETRIAGVDLVNMNRAPMNGSTQDRINIKALISPGDVLADIDPALYRKRKHSSDDLRKAIRRELAANTGLLLLYPISGVSHPRRLGTSGENRPEPVRIAMPEGTPTLLGFGIVFPNVRGYSGVEGEFFSVRSGWETYEYDEFDDVDLESDSDEIEGIME